jgi:methyl-accepting chemotaxis protein
VTDDLGTSPSPDPVTKPAPAATSTTTTQPAPQPPFDAAEGAAEATAAVAVSPQGSSTATPTARRRTKVLGIAAQVAGVLGIVVCLALVVGVLLGRGWATDSVTQVAVGVDEKLALAVPLMDKASAKVSEVSGRVGALADAATTVAALPGPGAELRTGLRSALNRVSERYLELRSSFGDVQQAAGGALDRLQTLEQLLPGFELPQGPVDALARLDAGVQELDATIVGLADAVPETGPIAAVATAAAARATRAQERLQEVNGAIDDARIKLDEVRAKVASTADGVNTGVTLGALGTILVLLYFVLLHWVLFRTGGRLRRGASVR